MAGETILIIDDEKEIVDLIEVYLKSEGYKVLKANNGKDAIALLDKYPIQLAILDIMMPGMNGLEVCMKIRQEHNIPIIMLSAKSEDLDKILGLGTGADDYITKPFNPLELIARVKSQLRRYLYLSTKAPDLLEKTIDIRGLAINREAHSVTIFNNNISLTPTEFEILLLLASNPGRVYSAEEIFKKVWKENYFDSDNTVMVHIRKIREKIEENPRKPIFIKTIWGVGYKIDL